MWKKIAKPTQLALLLFRYKKKKQQKKKNLAYFLAAQKFNASITILSGKIFKLITVRITLKYY